MINAYTFEIKNPDAPGKQIQPYSAKVDARIRRDIFGGRGDLVFSGRLDGQLNDPQFNNRSGSKITTRFLSSTVFTAGGRMFSITDEDITLTIIKSNGSEHHVKFAVKIDTNDANGNFVSIVEPRDADNNQRDFEADVFYSVFDFIAVTGNDPRDVKIYAGPNSNGQVAAGTTINIASNGVTAYGTTAGYHGQIINEGNYYLSDDNGVFTLNAQPTQIKYDGEDILFGRTMFPTIFVPKIDRDGFAVIFHRDTVFSGKLSINTDKSKGYLFRLSNVAYPRFTETRPKPSESPSSSGIHVIGNWAGEWTTI